MSKKYTTIIRRDENVIDFNAIQEVKNLKDDLLLKCTENENLCKVVKEIQNRISTISENSCSLENMLKEREQLITELTLKLSNSSNVITDYETKINKLENLNNEIYDNVESYKNENKLMQDNLELYILSNNELKSNYDSLISSYNQNKSKYDKLNTCLIKEREWFLNQIDNLHTTVINLNKLNTEKDEYIFQQDKIIKEYLNIFLFNNETYFMSEDGEIINIQSENEFNEIIKYAGDNAALFFKNTLIELYENAKKLKKEIDIEIYKNIIFEQNNLEMKKLYTEYQDDNKKMSKENIFLKKKVNMRGDKILMEEFEKEIMQLNAQIEKLKQENEDTVKKYTDILANTNSQFYEEINAMNEKLNENIKSYDFKLLDAHKHSDNLQNMLDIKNSEFNELENLLRVLENKKENCHNCKELHNDKNILENRIQELVDYSNETDDMLKLANNSIKEKNKTIMELNSKLEEIETNKSNEVKDDNTEVLNKKIQIQNGIISELKSTITDLKNNEILMMNDIQSVSDSKKDLRDEIRVLKQKEVLYDCEKEDILQEIKKEKEENSILKEYIINYYMSLKIMQDNEGDHEKLVKLLRNQQEQFEKNNFNFV